MMILNIPSTIREPFKAGFMYAYELDQKNCTITITTANETITHTYKGLEDLPMLYVCLKNKGEYSIPKGYYDGAAIQQFKKD